MIDDIFLKLIIQYMHENDIHNNTDHNKIFLLIFLPQYKGLSLHLHFQDITFYFNS